MKTELIAEIGQNHNGDIELAKKMIRAAKEAGADVAKFQLFNARALFPTKEEGNDWFDYNCKTEITKEQLHLLVDECRKAGIEFMASVFDEERVVWIEELGIPRYKVASRSVHDRKLLEKIYATGKPIIFSLGMWKGETFPQTPDNSRTSFLYCISKYPTALQDVHLDRIDFNKYAGFSDHTIGVSATIAALARGARIIEKHLTLDKTMYGPDHAGSATPDEFKTIDRFRKDLEKLA